MPNDNNTLQAGQVWVASNPLRVLITREGAEDGHQKGLYYTDKGPQFTSSESLSHAECAALDLTGFKQVVGLDTVPTRALPGPWTQAPQPVGCELRWYRMNPRTQLVAGYVEARLDADERYTWLYTLPSGAMRPARPDTHEGAMRQCDRENGWLG
jgi:hypothetical protein